MATGSSGGSNGGSNGGGTAGWMVSPGAMASRIARTWTITIPTANAFTHVAAYPTTLAELVLYNPTPDKTYFIDQAWWMSLTSIAAAAATSLIYQVVKPTVAQIPADNAAILVNSPYGKTYGGQAVKALSQTIMVANKWAMLKTGESGPAASIGFGMLAESNGRIQLKPGWLLGLNVVVGTAAGTGLLGCSWSEERIPFYE